VRGFYHYVTPHFFLIFVSFSDFLNVCDVLIQRGLNETVQFLCSHLLQTEQCCAQSNVAVLVQGLEISSRCVVDIW
jgi:hypothetical protein